MKKIFKLVALAALFATSVFTGCNNYFSNDVYYGNADGNSDFGEKSITISATTEDGMLTFNNNSRTLLPTHLSSTDVAFYLGFRKKGESTYTWKQVTFTPKDITPGTPDSTGCIGTVTEIFVLGSYDFTLYAVPSADAAGIGAAPTDDTTISPKALFVGYAAADLRYNDVVSFYLTSNNLSGQGSVKLTIQTLWSVPADYTVKAGLYGYSDDTQKYPSGGDGTLAATGTTTDGATTYTNAINETNWTAGDANVAAGSYNLKVTFHNTKTNKDYIYSEKIIILPNRRTEGTIEIPEIIDRAPTQPADLIVGYSKPEAADINYYKVEFAWTDTAYNEKQFQLEIMSVDDSSATPVFFDTPANDTDWNALTTNPNLQTASTVYVNQIKTYASPLTTQKRLSESQYDVEGSLNMNNNHVVIYLPMEHRYVARIRASNDTYDTDWTYANLHSATKQTVGCTKDSSITVGANTFITKVNTSQYTLIKATDIFPADVATINQYKITYNLAGGLFKGNADFTAPGAAVTGTDLPSSTSKPYYVFESQHVDAGPAASTTKVAVLTPTGKEANNAVTPAVTASNGASNIYVPESDIFTPYATQTTKTAYLQLTDVDGFFWKEWWIDGKYEAVSAADTTNKFAYPSTAVVCNVYTGYKNLNLFANYDVLPLSGPQDISVELADINKYELKPDFIQIKLNNSTTDQTASIIGGAAATPPAPNTFDNMPKLTEFQVGTVTNINLKILGTDLKDGNNTPFNYDSVRVVITKLTPSNYREIYNSSFSYSGGDWTVDINGIDLPPYTAGIFYLEVQATTNKYPLVTYNQKITLKLTDE